MKCGTCKNTPRLNNRVTVRKLKSNLTPNAAGHIDEADENNWTNAGTEWVEIVTRGSREFFRGEEVAADITHQIKMRWTNTAANYTTDMKIKLDNRTLNIAEPPRNIDEQNEWLVFAAVEIK